MGEDIEGEGQYDNFGVCVSLSKDVTRVAIGTMAEYVRVYEWHLEAFRRQY